MSDLQAELESLRTENARLRKLLKPTDAEAAQARGTQTAWFDEAPGSVDGRSSSRAKVELYAALFGARPLDTPDSRRDAGSSGSTLGGNAMEWLLLALAVGGGGWGAKKWRDRQELRRSQAEELAGVRRLADEDVTYLGEQLQRLDREVAGHDLDEDTRVEYQEALDSYESAQRAVPRIRSADEISKITDTLSSGRYALACVQARVAGRPLPELRVACFFNPQHGPSVTDVVWTPPGHGSRTVPACAQDAARLAQHEAPEVRKVKIGSRLVPYWAAGAAFHPYSEGYFASAAMLLWTYQPPIVPDGGGFGAGFGGDSGGGGGFEGGGGNDFGGGGDAGGGGY